MKRQEERKAWGSLHKLMSASYAKHNGYTYVNMGITGHGDQWALANVAGETVCKSVCFSDKRDCLKMLRAVQRHAATTHVADDSAQ